MTKAISFARTITADPVEGLRMVIVLASAAALMLAGEIFPAF